MLILPQLPKNFNPNNVGITRIDLSTLFPTTPLESVGLSVCYWSNIANRAMYADVIIPVNIVK